MARYRLFKRKKKNPHSGIIYELPTWHCAFMGADGREKRKSTKTADEDLANTYASHWARVAYETYHGMTDPEVTKMIQNEARHLSEHLQIWHDSMILNMRSQKHADVFVRYIERMAKLSGIRLAVDLDDHVLTKWRKHMIAENKSARTINASMMALKAFTKWLKKSGQIRKNKFEDLKIPIVKEDHGRVIVHKDISRDEFAILMRFMPNMGRRGRLNACQRMMFYKIALGTGFRCNECKTLKVNQLHIDHEPPYIRILGENTKNGETEEQPITEELARDLKNFVFNKELDECLFPANAMVRAAEIVRRDMNEAREAYLATLPPETRQEVAKSDFMKTKDSHGQVLTFHSLRHTYGTWLSKVCNSAKDLQTLMRHKDPKTTFRYLHTNLHSLAESVSNID